MLKKTLLCSLALCCLSGFLSASDLGLKKGTPKISSISQLEFNDDGILFLGDSEGAKIFAVDLQDTQKSSYEEAVSISDLEGEIAAIMGTTAENILIHDMAINPISRSIYVSVSRGRAKWSSKWQLPNDLASADILLKITPEGDFSEVRLENC